MTTGPTTEVRRAAERYLTRAEGRTTRHSFAFGPHYDPHNLGFAAMLAHNDEDLPPGTGYPDHPHTDLEIVTWVLAGALRHTASDGTSGVLEAGEVQRVSAGSGIVHAEVTEPGTHTRFLQTWLRPDEPGVAPSYARTDAVAHGLTEVVGPAGLGIGTAGATLSVGSPATGALVLPEADHLHLFVVEGSLDLDAHTLGPGDAARLREQGGRTVGVGAGTRLAVWAFGT